MKKVKLSDLNKRPSRKELERMRISNNKDEEFLTIFLITSIIATIILFILYKLYF